MPNMANITVKAANGTTDVVYVAMTPSSGDKVAARWRVEAASTIPAHRAVASLVTRDNGNGSARRAEFNFMLPYVFTPEGGLPAVTDRVPVSITAALPKGIPDTVIAEAIAQAGNLFVSTLIRDSLKSGYAPT